MSKHCFSLLFLLGNILWVMGENESPVRFIQNDGQWDAEIRYKVPLRGGNIYFCDNKIQYAFHRTPSRVHNHGGAAASKMFGGKLLQQATQNDSITRRHSVWVEFLGANAAPEVQPADEKAMYHNYFQGNDKRRWKSRVPLFGEVTYQSLYNGISMHVGGVGEALKYTYEVAAGANAAALRLRYTGADSVYITPSGMLRVATSLRDFTESAPIAWQQIGERQVRVACAFRQAADGSISFAFPNGYDATKPLTIDPTVIFSTYTGSGADDWGYTATYDNDGNAYGGSLVFGVGYLTTPGAYDGSYASPSGGGVGVDVGIIKYTPTGNTAIYSTYLGGNGNDVPASLVANSKGELFVLGRTESFNFPVFTSSADNSQNGNFDIFIAKFNTNGDTLLGSTFFGGSGDDGVNFSPYNYSVINNAYSPTKYNYADDTRGEIVLDAQENVLIAGSTQSAGLASTGAFQQSLLGNQDGIIAKFNALLTQKMWSSYIGGTNDDAAYGVQLDSKGNVFVAGGTMSNNIVRPSGGHRGSYQGGSADGFIAKIDAGGGSMSAFTYVGTSSYDQAYFVQTDRYDNVYVVGQTESNSYPIMNATFTNAGAKQFITKYTNNLNQIMRSTCFGTTSNANPNIALSAFLVDRCGNIYVSGWGGNLGNQNPGASTGTSGMVTTANAFQSTTDGGDFYLIALDANFALLYASFFGGNTSAGSGEHVDGGTSRFDKDGVVYQAVCAGCGGLSSFPTTPGVWSPNNGSNNCNLGVFKIEFNLAGIAANFVPEDSKGLPISSIIVCAPADIHFDNKTKTTSQTTFLWDFGDGTTSTAKLPVHTYAQPDTYAVRLIAIDSSTCNVYDTVYRNVIVNPPPNLIVSPNDIICPNETSQLLAKTQTGISAQFTWLPTTGLSSATVPNPIAQPTATTKYYVTAKDVNNCVSKDSITVTLDNSLKAFPQADTQMCQGVATTLKVGTTTGNKFQWQPAAMLVNDTLQNPKTVGLMTTTKFDVTITNPNGCKVDTSIVVDIFEIKLTADTALCKGDSVQITAAATNAQSYSWQPKTFISDPASGNPIVFPPQTAQYTVTGVSKNGCISNKQVNATVWSLPIANAGKDSAICRGSSTQLLGSGGKQYRWSPVATLNRPDTIAPIATPLLTTRYFLTVTDSNGCKDKDSVLITVNTLPVLTLTPSDTICAGDSLLLQISGTSTFIWSPDTSLKLISNASVRVKPTRTTTYFVKGLDGNSCEKDTSVTIFVIQPPLAIITGTNRTCAGLDIVLAASGANNYLWNTGDTTHTIYVNPATPTTYTVTPFIGKCYGKPVSVFVGERYAYPVAGFDFLPADTGWIPAVFTFQSTSVGQLKYYWDFDLRNGLNDNVQDNAYTPLAKHAYVEPHPGAFIYTVTHVVATPYNCRDTIQKEILVHPVTIYAPNAITPNGDDMNEAFLVGYRGIADLKVQIFDRWGELLYEADARDFRWDATYKGDDVPEGVYVWVIKATGKNGLVYDRLGTVTVTR